jgi:hypothetical protein
VAKQRKALPIHVRTEVLIEAGFRCAVPTCRTILAIDLHHIVKVSQGGPDDASNLLALCPTCHALYHRGEIAPEAILVWKSMLVSLNQGFDREAKDKLLFLAVTHRPKLFSADGVLAFTGLIASGLVKCGPERLVVHARGSGADISKSRYPLELTEKGRMVVEAWRRGDQLALGKALALGAGPALT